MRSRYYQATLIVLSLLALMDSVGCGKLLGNLRRDIEDTDYDSDDESIEAAQRESTIGGTWAERRYLESSEDRESNRSIASDGEYRRRSSQSNGSSWFSPRSRENTREIVRNYPTPTKNPVLQPDVKRLYKNGNRATRDDFIDQSQEEGSLWASGGQTNYYFTKNKIRSPGDLVTLVVENDLFRDVGFEIKKTLSAKERDLEVSRLQDAIRLRAAAPQSSPVPAPSGTPQDQVSKVSLPSVDSEKDPSDVRFEDVNINPSLDFKIGETMMGEIVERFPNGNYKIRTIKRIPYKKGLPRLVSVVGIVKPTDISEDTDTINSGKLYEYRVEVSR